MRLLPGIDKQIFYTFSTNVRSKLMLFSHKQPLKYYYGKNRKFHTKPWYRVSLTIDVSQTHVDTHQLPLYSKTAKTVCRAYLSGKESRKSVVIWNKKVNY